MNDLLESSKGNIYENFCGVAVIVFNTIKEKEKKIICLKSKTNVFIVL